MADEATRRAFYAQSRHFPILSHRYRLYCGRLSLDPPDAGPERANLLPRMMSAPVETAAATNAQLKQ
jgi:hypothetical protein